MHAASGPPPGGAVLVVGGKRMSSLLKVATALLCASLVVNVARHTYDNSAGGRVSGLFGSVERVSPGGGLAGGVGHQRSGDERVRGRRRGKALRAQRFTLSDDGGQVEEGEEQVVDLPMADDTTALRRTQRRQRPQSDSRRVPKERRPAADDSPSSSDGGGGGEASTVPPTLLPRNRTLWRYTLTRMRFPGYPDAIRAQRPPSAPGNIATAVRGSTSAEADRLFKAHEAHQRRCEVTWCHEQDVKRPALSLLWDGRSTQSEPFQPEGGVPGDDALGASSRAPQGSQIDPPLTLAGILQTLGSSIQWPPGAHEHYRSLPASNLERKSHQQLANHRAHEGAAGERHKTKRVAASDAVSTFHLLPSLFSWPSQHMSDVRRTQRKWAKVIEDKLKATYAADDGSRRPNGPPAIVVHPPERPLATTTAHAAENNDAAAVGDARLVAAAVAPKCNRKRDAVFGYATTFKRDKIQAFIESFLRHSTACDDLVLWVDEDLLPEVWSTHTGKGRLVMYHERTWVAWAQQRFADRGLPKGSANTERIAVFLLWIELFFERYRYVVHVDTRDSLFYANLFRRLERLRVTGLFSVAEVHLFNGQGHNNLWVNTYARTPTAGNFISNMKLHGRWLPVLCSGIYGGDSVAVLDYLAAFTDAISKAPKEALELLGIDQGVHVFLQLIGLPLARFPHAISVLDEATGPMHHWFSNRPGSAVRRDKLGRYLNCLDEPYAVVHQLDRYKAHWDDAFRYYETRGGSQAVSMPSYPSYYPTRLYMIDTERQYLQHLFIGSTAGGTAADRGPPSLLLRGAESPEDAMPHQGAPPATFAAASTVCASLHVAMVFVPRAVDTDREVFARVQAFIASFQRYHSGACDELVVLRPPPPTALSPRPARFVLQRTPRVTIVSYQSAASPSSSRSDTDASVSRNDDDVPEEDPSARLRIAWQWLSRKRKTGAAAAAPYRLVAVFDDVASPCSSITLSGNVFLNAPATMSSHDHHEVDGEYGSKQAERGGTSKAKGAGFLVTDARNGGVDGGIFVATPAVIRRLLRDVTIAPGRVSRGGHRQPSVASWLCSSARQRPALRFHDVWLVEGPNPAAASTLPFSDAFGWFREGATFLLPLGASAAARGQTPEAGMADDFSGDAASAPSEGRPRSTAAWHHDNLSTPLPWTAVTAAAAAAARRVAVAISPSSHRSAIGRDTPPPSAPFRGDFNRSKLGHPLLSGGGQPASHVYSAVFLSYRGVTAQCPEVFGRPGLSGDEQAAAASGRDKPLTVDAAAVDFPSRRDDSLLGSTIYREALKDYVVKEVRAEGRQGVMPLHLVAYEQSVEGHTC